MIKKLQGKLILSGLLVSFHFIPLLSQENRDVINAISNDIETFSEVATTTRNNKLYQPYILSVFHSNELERLGIANLEEALKLVPGLDMSTDNINYKSPIFRGSNPVAFGQSKLFIDDVLVNDLFIDGYQQYLSMPIEMIKRIEVVRGPGSQIDGFNAYAGSIRVVTYAESLKGFESDDKVVFKAGSYDYLMGGFVKSYQDENFKFYSDFTYQRDHKELPAGPDGLSQNIIGKPNAHLSKSGNAPLWSESYNLGVTLNYNNFTLKSRLTEYTQGSAYGINYALPKEEDRIKLPNYYLELGYLHSNNNYNIEIKAGVKINNYNSRAHLLPEGTILPSLTPPTSIVSYPEGFYGIHEAKQQELYQSTYLKYSGFNKHLITTGYRVLQDKTTSVSTKTTDRDSGIGITDYSESYPFFDENAKRESIIVSLQDHYDYNKKLSFIYGFNAEKRVSLDLQIDPRISIVYRADSKNIFKAMYSKSHRNPSWQEMFTLNNRSRIGNPNLDAESVQALEAVYIRKLSTNDYIQANLFYLENKNQITQINSDNHFDNITDTKTHGLELEYKGKITSKDQFYINYSYVEAKNNDDYLQANVAKHLTKSYYIYNFTPYLSLSAIIKYISSKERSYDDTRDTLQGYFSADTALYYKNSTHDFTLSLSVKNITDSDIIYPAKALTYKNDYQQEGRNILVRLVKSF